MSSLTKEVKKTLIGLDNETLLTIKTSHTFKYFYISKTDSFSVNTVIVDDSIINCINNILSKRNNNFNGK